MIEWKVVEIHPEPALSLRVRFADGLEGKVQYLPENLKGLLAKLKDPDIFNQAFIDHGAVNWPDAIDVCPETMHKMIKASPDHLWVC